MKTIEEALKIIDENGGRIDGTICTSLKGINSILCNESDCVLWKEFGNSPKVCTKDNPGTIIRNHLRKKKLAKLLDKPSEAV